VTDVASQTYDVAIFNLSDIDGDGSDIPVSGVQGPQGGGTPLLLLKRKVKKMIEEEDRSKPLTDEQITAMLCNEGINVTRRTVAKYREDMKIPSTHQRRVRNN